MADPSASDDSRRGEGRTFRWQALLQNSRDALFLLNQYRRLLLVNRAWEEATEFPFNEVRGLVCRRRSAAEPASLDALAGALAPPPEVFEGRPAHVRRRVLGVKRLPQWWDLEFLPLQDGRGRLRILGKLAATGIEDVPRPAALPDRLTGLRERLDQRYTLASLNSELLPMRRVLEQVRIACQSFAPVLLIGESGTGKQWTARVIHHQGLHPERHFAALDCARLPPAMLEEALFGAGGLWQQPGQGTVYLAEVTQLPRDLQARIFERIGEGVAPQSPRLLAGSSSDPIEAVRAQRFLDRLHAALSPLVIELPPLRDRPADLQELIDRLLTRIQPLGEKKIAGLTPPALELSREHGWPGNLDELHALLAAGCRRAQGPLLDSADLPGYLRLRAAVAGEPAARPVRALPLATILEEVERRLIVLALRHAKGNRSRAAELLELWRPQLLRRMEKLGIK